MAKLWIFVVLYWTSCVHSERGDNETIHRRYRDRFWDDSDERRLLRHLLRDYSIEGRPIKNISTIISVGFGLGLIQLELNEKDKMLTMSAWSRYTWKDEYLQWNPVEYSSIFSVRLDVDLIWSPDIELYNTADVEIPLKNAMAVVRYDGSVVWFPQAIFRSSCAVDTTNFPFDEQKCSLAFGSWTHTSQEMDLFMLFPGGIDLCTFKSDHYDASSWDVYDVTADRQTTPSQEKGSNFTMLTFELYFRRKVSFQSYILTLPCIFLSVLTITVFLIPADRTDRIGLAFGTFGSLLVLLLLLVEASPSSPRSVPTLGVFYLINIVIVFAAIMISAVIVNIIKGPIDKRTRVPKIFAAIFLEGFGRMFCLHSMYGPRRRALKEAISQEEGSTSEHCRDGGVQGSGGLVSPHHRGVDTEFYLDTTRIPESMSQLATDISDIHRRVSKLICEVNKTASSVKLTASILLEWQQLALALDRLFFCMYVITITVSLAFFFPRPQIFWWQLNALGNPDTNQTLQDSCNT